MPNSLWRRINCDSSIQPSLQGWRSFGLRTHSLYESPFRSVQKPENALKAIRESTLCIAFLPIFMKDALVKHGAVLPLVAVGADSLAIEAVVEVEVPTAGSAAGRLTGFEHLVDSGKEHPQCE